MQCWMYIVNNSFSRVFLRQRMQSIITVFAQIALRQIKEIGLV